MCKCSSVAARSQLPNEEELLSLVPYTERAMVGCLLQKPLTRAALRRRLRTCLRDNSLTTTMWPSQPPALPPLRLWQPPPVEISSTVSPAVLMPTVEKPRSVASDDSVVESKQERPEKDPLLRDLKAARAVEEVCNPMGTQAAKHRHALPPPPQLLFDDAPLAHHSLQLPCLFFPNTLPRRSCPLLLLNAPRVGAPHRSRQSLLLRP